MWLGLRGHPVEALQGPSRRLRKKDVVLSASRKILEQAPSFYHNCFFRQISQMLTKPNVGVYVSRSPVIYSIH